MSNPITNYPVVGSVIGTDLLWDWQAGAQQSCTMNQVKAFLLGGGSIAVAGGKTLTASNTLTFTGTDGSTVVFGAGGTVLYAANIGSAVQAWSAKLDALAALSAPGTSGLVLSSTTGGALSWKPLVVTGAASGTNIYVATPSPALTAYVTGLYAVITFANENTGGSSLNLNGLGAVPVQQNGLAIAAGTISANSTIAVIYDGTNFQIVGNSDSALTVCAQIANNGSDFASLSQTLKNLWASIGTTLGDLIYSAASGVATRLAGNTSGTKKFLTQTGTGSVSAAPAWSAVALTDLPFSGTADDTTFARGDGTWAEPEAAFPWLIKTSAYTAVAGDRIQADTLTTGAFTITLPATATVGDSIQIEDANGNWGTSNLTIAFNGLKINGSASNYVASVTGNKLSCVYISSAYGWSVK